MGAASVVTATTSFAAPMAIVELQTATTTATLAMPTTVIAAAGIEHLTPAPGTSERKHMSPALGTSKPAHHAGHVECRRDGSQLHRLAYRVRHSRGQQRHQTANLQRAGQDRDHEVASARQQRPFGPVTPTERGNYRSMIKCSDHSAKFKAGYFISTKDKALTTQVKFTQDFVAPLGRHLQHLRTDGGSEFIADYFRDCCKTPVIIHQFSSPNTPEHNVLKERDSPTIMNLAW